MQMFVTDLTRSQRIAAVVTGLERPIGRQLMMIGSMMISASGRTGGLRPGGRRGPQRGAVGPETSGSSAAGRCAQAGSALNGVPTRPLRQPEGEG
jgi:hypothetical protein